MIEKQLNKESVLSLMQEYYANMQEAVLSLINPGSVACHNGCTFCCYLHITVKPYELLPLVSYIKSRPDAERQIMRSKIEDNCEKLDSVTDDEILLLNFDCPFLVDGSCAVYDHRPTSCRSAHSKSVEVCEKAYKFPAVDLEVDHVEGYVDLVRDIEQTLEDALGEYHDVSDYNFNMALKEALDDSEWFTRFCEGDEVFSDDALSRV